MEVIPAIDLRGGRCVRLQQGDYGRETVFGEDPIAMAEHWQAEGATRLHLVDLDGARDGRAAHSAVVRKIVERLDIPCQLGGGVRSTETLEAWIDAGLDRVIVGTAALKDRDWFARMARRYPGRVVLGLDARDGRVATDGWLDVSSVEAVDLAREFDSLPLAAVVYTDIARDGMLEGPNLTSTGALARALRTPVIASGGVGSLDDVARVAELPVSGCIVGRALYEGRFRLGEARSRADAVASPSPGSSREGTQ
jgi:phosphoribosylformimino-5-aminoimidazole carboxamide ribotide isomerase